MPSWQRTLAVMVGVQFCSAVGFSIIFPFLPLYVAELDSTMGWSVEALSGLVFSVQALTMAVASPFWGVVADRYGRKLMVMRATLGGAVVILLMGFVANVEQLVALRAVQGLFTGVIAAANALIASVAPRERTGYAMGLLQVGLWSGVSAGPLLGGILSDLLGFRATFAVTSAILLVASVGVWLGVEDPFVRQESTPGGLAFVRDWVRVLSDARLACVLSLRFLVATGRATLEPLLPLFVAQLARLVGEGRHPHRPDRGRGVGGQRRHVRVARPPRRPGRPWSRGRLVCGRTAVGAVPQAFVTGVWQLLWLQALTGASVGGLIPSLSALLARNSRRGDEGCVYGIDNSITSLGRTVAPLLGAACAVWFSLRGVFLLTSLIFVAVAIAAALTLSRAIPPETR